MDPKYMEWLHAITLLGYDENVMIPFNHKELLEAIYKEGHTPEIGYNNYKQIIIELEDESSTN